MGVVFIVYIGVMLCLGIDLVLELFNVDDYFCDVVLMIVGEGWFDW